MDNMIIDSKIILESHRNHMQDTAKRIIQRAKQNSTTYGEILNKLDHLERSTRFALDERHERDLYGLVFETARLMIDEERNGQLVTDRPDPAA